MKNRVGGSVVPAGGLLSITIADSTNIDQNGSSIGVNGNGWVAIVVLKGLTSLVGTAAPSDLTLTVRDPGYDTSGNATTITRTITGVAHLRRQYPNGASKMISTDGTDLTLYITLDDWIYSGTTLVSAAIGSSFYPLCAASSAGTKTNSSTLAYTKPVFGWVNPQQEIATASTHAVEAVAFHRHAIAGQQVACIKYQANDGSTNGTEITVSAPTLSTRQTQGFVGEVWAGTVDMSAMTQAATCNINAKVYPWLGDSSAVLDLSADGVSWPTGNLQTRLRVVCDRTGGYSGAYAYVDGTGGGTPAVSSVAATARSNPYATITAALAAIKTWNNSNKGHDDIGGSFIRLMDNAGGDKTHTIASSATNAPGAGYCTIEKDPLSSAVVTVTHDNAGTNQIPHCLKFKNLKLTPSAGAENYTLIGYNTAGSVLCLENCLVDNSANKQVVTWMHYKYLLNCTFEGSATIKLNGLVGTAHAVVSLIGCVSNANVARPTTNDSDAQLTMGNNLPYLSMRLWESANPGGIGDHGRITYNNRLMSAVFARSGTDYTLTRGFAVVQNLFEYDGTDGTVAPLHAFSDGDRTTISNYIDMHNTCVGERVNRFYNDVVATQVAPSGIQKIGTFRYSLYDNYNWKGDTFNSAASIIGSVGTWPSGYGVDSKGIVSLFGAVSRGTSDAPHNDNTDVPYMGMAWLPSSEYNCRRAGLGSPSAATVMAYLTNYTVEPKASPAIGGNYQPVSGAMVLKSRVPAGFSVLLKDIAGNTRKTDGTGAAGCYEAAA